MSRKSSWLNACLKVGSAAVMVASFTTSGEAQFHWRKARVRPSLPPARYGMDDAVVSGSLVTSAGVEEQVILVLSTPNMVRTSAKESSAVNVAVPAAKTALAKRGNVGSTVAPTPAAALDDLPGPLVEFEDHHPNSVARSQIVRRKRYAPNTPDVHIALPNLELYQVGLFLYETGHVACSGKVKHTAGPDGIVKGNRVTVKVRGYGEDPLGTPKLPNGPLLFETTSTFWLNAGQDEAISLCRPEICERVRRHFDEIRHIEVKLSYQQDR